MFDNRFVSLPPVVIQSTDHSFINDKQQS
jgi:hypothetical protein